MADHNDDSNISPDENIEELYPELQTVMSDYAILLILQGLEEELHGHCPANYDGFINKLNSPCILYCIKQSVINPRYARFNYYPTEILTAIFNIDVITVQPMNFPEDDADDAAANHAPPFTLFTSHTDTNVRDDINPKYYQFISIIYELYRRSVGPRVPSGLDRIIKYLEEHKPQTKSSEKR